jgi:tetratricopeptide (TPR) repeat protein
LSVKKNSLESNKICFSSENDKIMKKYFRSQLIALNLIFSLTFGVWLPLFGQGDIVGGATEDISGGSSVFVFRKNRNAKQNRAFTRSQRTTQQKVVQRAKINTQISLVAKNKPKPKPKAKALNKPSLDTLIAQTKKKPKPKPKPGVTEPVKPTEDLAKAAETIAASADVFAEQGDIESAGQYYEDALEIDPTNKTAQTGYSELLTKRGDSSVIEGNFLQAKTFYEEAIKLNDKNAGGYAGLGQVYDALDQSEPAITNFEKALQLDSALTEIHYPLGVLYYEAKNYDQADNHFNFIRQNRQDDAEAQNYFGLVYSRQGRDAEAIAAFQSAINLNKSYAEAYFNLGEVYSRQAENFERDKRDKEANEAFRNAVAAYQQATAIEPKFIEAWFNLGAAYYNRKMYKDAIAPYQKVIALRTTYVEARNNLADTFRQLGDAENNSKYYDEAISVYRVLVSLNKDRPLEERSDTYSKFGYVLGKIRRWDEAIREINHSLELKPDEYDYTNLSWAYSNYGREDINAKLRYLNARQLDQAKTKEVAAREKLTQAKIAGQKAVQMNPNFPAAYFNLGNALALLEEYDASIAALQKAISLRSNWVAAYNSLGFAYLTGGRFNEAVTALKEAIRLDDNFVGAHYNLGIAELQRGNRKEAEKELKYLRDKKQQSLADNLEYLIKATSQPRKK